jgi:hypothetical protein
MLMCACRCPVRSIKVTFMTHRHQAQGVIEYFGSPILVNVLAKRAYFLFEIKDSIHFHGKPSTSLPRLDLVVDVIRKAPTACSTKREYLRSDAVTTPTSTKTVVNSDHWSSF